MKMSFQAKTKLNNAVISLKKKGNKKGVRWAISLTHY